LQGGDLFARNEEEKFESETDVLTTYLDMKYTYDLFESGYLARPAGFPEPPRSRVYGS